MTHLRSKADVVAYLRTLIASDLPLDAASELAVEEITDGNLNYAFSACERGSPERAVFLKQAPGFIKCLGEGYKLSSSRALLEGAVLRIYGELAPDYVPKLMHLDEDNRIMVMEMLSGHTLQRSALSSGDWAPRHVADVATFLALTHSRSMPGSPLAAKLAHGGGPDFSNPDMCAITADYVFTKPLGAADATNRCSVRIHMANRS